MRIDRQPVECQENDGRDAGRALQKNYETLRTHNTATNVDQRHVGLSICRIGDGRLEDEGGMKIHRRKVGRQE